LLSKKSEVMQDSRRHLTGVKESVNEITRKTRGLVMALYEITDHYIHAERNALNGYDRVITLHSSGRQAVKVPTIRNSSGAVLFEKTVLPDWLQLAVLEFERSQD